jgi:NADH:ubiquinone oxidoreductase subunit 5 (subunit L)/multisubunit Na+/H+ antiporter MnhA subunit
MPWTGATFLIGAAAIAGLPPLNGFASEFLIYLGAYSGIDDGLAGDRLPMLGVIAGLALIGGLAAACFTKAFGIVFLGEPRSRQAAEAHESGGAMLLPLIILAGACIVIGVAAPVLLGAMVPVLRVCTRLPVTDLGEQLAAGVGPLKGVTLGAAVLFALVGGLALWRRWLLRGRSVRQTVTWDCGYAEPTARMQYTASSFAQPLTDFFRIFLRSHREFDAPQGTFPAPSSLETHTPDVAKEWLYRPVFGSVGWLAGKVRWLQQGRVQLYVLYITMTLLVLLIWRLG